MNTKVHLRKNREQQRKAAKRAQDAINHFREAQKKLAAEVALIDAFGSMGDI